jgi:hypothetical protein
MPYGIIKRPGTNSCFSVVNPLSSHIFSKRCQTKKMARKQQIALALSESRKTGKPVKSFFVK